MHWKQRPSIAVSMVTQRGISRRIFAPCFSFHSPHFIAKRTFSSVLSRDISRILADTIKLSGPIPIADYMKQCLLHPHTGFYQKRDVFGGSGDFITSPDISQLFGEMLGIWILMQWEAAGAPQSVKLVELGPGRATLLDDILRTVSQFPKFLNALEGVELVERGEALMQIQRERLCAPQEHPSFSDNNVPSCTLRWREGANVEWHHDLTKISQVSSEESCWRIVLAHEFFDALPIHRFQLTEHGWREILIDTTERVDDSQQTFRFVLAKGDTKASQLLLPMILGEDIVREPAKRGFAIGAQVEISPESAKVIDQVATIVSKAENNIGGAGLIIDYGKDHPQSETLRGIKGHRFVDVLSEPGMVDLSADVDFSMLRKFASRKVDVHGPVKQETFLHQLGIQHRLQMLLKATQPERHQGLISGYQRLVGTGAVGMGDIYKAMALVPKGASTPTAFQ